MSHHLFRMHEAVLRSAPIRPGDRILYLGADSAALSAVMADRLAEGGELVGLDFSFATLQRAEHVLAASAHKTMLFMRLEGPAIPYPDDYFDLAIAFGTQDKRPQLEGVMSDLARVLKPEARLYWHDAGAGWQGLRERLLAIALGNSPGRRTAPAKRAYTSLCDKLGAHFSIEFSRRWTHSWGKQSCLLVGKKL